MSDYMHSESRSESMKAARAKYDKLNTRFYGLKLNFGTDLPLIELLDNTQNKQSLIKDALKMYIIAGSSIVAGSLRQYDDKYNTGD